MSPGMVVNATGVTHTDLHPSIHCSCESHAVLGLRQTRLFWTDLVLPNNEAAALLLMATIEKFEVQAQNTPLGFGAIALVTGRHKLSLDGIQATLQYAGHRYLIVDGDRAIVPCQQRYLYETRPIDGWECQQCGLLYLPIIPDDPLVHAARRRNLCWNCFVLLEGVESSGVG